MADEWFASTALPIYGPRIPTEDILNLFGDIKGKKVLDIGCGSGHSLKWCADKGVSELWGLDMSTKQIENAAMYLEQNNYTSNLYNAPMESDIGLPKNYFDICYSIYAIGWSTDLQTTFNNISSYLKKGGMFIFSWDHPIMHCINVENEKLIFEGCYLVDDWFSFKLKGESVTLQNHKFSTYINALSKAGFKIEQLIEETDKASLAADNESTSVYYLPCKAKKFPVSFIIKAIKL